MYQWRTFKFFGKQVLTPERLGANNSSLDSSGASQFLALTPSCSHSDRGHILFGTTTGDVHIFHRHLIPHTFTAHDISVLAVHQQKRQARIITLGLDTDAPCFKIWQYEASELMPAASSSSSAAAGGSGGVGASASAAAPSAGSAGASGASEEAVLPQLSTKGPQLVRRIRVFGGKIREARITAFAILDDLSQAAIGLENGSVLLFYGKLASTSAKCRVLQGEQKDGSEVTGLHFVETGLAGPAGLVLFVVTSRKVFSYHTLTKNGVNVLDEGDDLPPEALTQRTVSIVNDEKQLVVAREQAIYFYEHDMRGRCLVFDGPKRLVRWFNNYLIVATDPSPSNGGSAPSQAALGITAGGGPTYSESSDAAPSGASSSIIGTQSGGSGPSGAGGASKRPFLTTVTVYDLRNKFRAFHEKFENLVDIVSGWGTIFILSRPSRGTRSQLSLLSECDMQEKMHILFNKNFYSIAINLARSQNWSESEVQRIYKMYGDHLYDKRDFDGAMSQYLMTVGDGEPSYVIRKFLDAQRIHNLTRYLQALHSRGLANTNHTTLLLNCYTKLKDLDKLDEFVKDSSLQFDVQTAIKVCRQAGYNNNAIYLARKEREHDLLLQIMLNDEQAYAAALEHIWTLPFFEAEQYVRRYGKKLVTNLPDETTELLKELCSGYRQRSPARGGDGDGDDASSGNDEEPAVHAHAHGAGAVRERSAPVDFIHFFVDHPLKLREFLEFVRHEVPDCPPVVYNTLLELYLKDGGSIDDETPAAASHVRRSSSSPHPNSEQIIGLLVAERANYDVDHALVLCKMYRFEKGVILLYGKLRLFSEILQYHMQRHQHQKIIDACLVHGQHEPQLWVQALNYFSQVDEDNDSQQAVITVLQNIEAQKLMPPLLVVQQLARNPRKPLSAVKEFVIQTLQQENTTIMADRARIRDYEEDTQRMRDEIHELQTNATTFQNTSCGTCHTGLELPAVHFLCKHSFHERCLPDKDSPCPICADEVDHVLRMRSDLQKSAANHDAFFKELNDAEDGFTTVAEYCGRGIFDPVIRQADQGEDMP